MKDKSIKQLEKNIHSIQEKVTKHEKEKAKIVAVTKTVSTDVMKQMHQLGLNVFGENRANVLEEKLEVLQDIKDEIEWHFIGRLQTRPVRKIINQIDYLHSLDRLSLAKEIQKRAEHTIKCFVQVNVSGEESKTGLSPNELQSFITELAKFDKIEVVGLMTMAPIDATDEELHKQFSTLKQCQLQIEKLNLMHAPCHELSMGMSRDYLIALEEGATTIRIGTAFYQGIEDKG